jgi:methylenetetrahydrofolate--tRNA-(uracil-5-)-methyltransferase
MLSNRNVYFAGQITGVEGYIESASSGLVAGINAARQCLGHEPLLFPDDTAIGSLAAYISGNAAGKFQPMNASFGLINLPDIKIRSKKDRVRFKAQKALEQINIISEQE